MPEANELTMIPVSSSANENRRPESSNGSHGASTARVVARRRLPDERHSLTHHFSVGGQEGYVTIGLYEDGTPGEMFIRMSKEGSTVSGLMDSFATAVSLALQYGVPL
jgi:ribonucleoside-diphosphate reductase alpha chain